MFKLNRLGAGALVVALINFFLGEEAVQALGGAEAVSATISDALALIVGLVAIFRGTRKDDPA